MKTWNRSYNPLLNTESDERLSPPPRGLEEGEIGGLLIGSAFLLFLVLPVLLSYLLVYCKRLQVSWKNRREQECRNRSQNSDDVIESGNHGLVDQDETTSVLEEHHLPNAELTHSEPPPSYSSVVNRDSNNDKLLPPEYDCALKMEKV